MGPERRKRGNFGAYRTQKAGFPRKLALWIGKAGFSYMQIKAIMMFSPELVIVLHSRSRNILDQARKSDRTLIHID